MQKRRCIRASCFGNYSDEIALNFYKIRRSLSLCLSNCRVALGPQGEIKGSELGDLGSLTDLTLRGELQDLQSRTAFPLLSGDVHAGFVKYPGQTKLAKWARGLVAVCPYINCSHIPAHVSQTGSERTAPSPQVDDHASAKGFCDKLR